MAKLRNTTSETLLVPLVGREVAPDELVEVSDDVYAAHAWPDTVWAVAEEPHANEKANKRTSGKEQS